MLDLTGAVVVRPKTLTPIEQKAVDLLIKEVNNRSQVNWEEQERWPVQKVPVIAIGSMASFPDFTGPLAARLTQNPPKLSAEGFWIDTEPEAPAVFVVGSDARGVLFGVSRLLRELRMTKGSVRLQQDFRIASSPRYPLRGHQLGYRPKTNSYDGWDVSQWDQYIRDLAIFGTNAIELIPPRSDDDAHSPHFPLAPMDMMVQMSRLCDEYGLDVWVWYPAMDQDYAKPEVVEFALKEWGEVFRKLPRIDAVFVPGGDPGHTRPKLLMALLEKETEVLHRFHPRAQMWVSPQSFNQEWLDEFYGLLKAEPSWLSGVVFGPQTRVSLPELRKAVPRRYPIRHYPDITHSLQCQYPVPDWDLAFALTEGREVINPRPLGQATIFHAFEHDSIGFLTYSEGCNDDVNKIVWSALGWDPDTPVIDILRQYSRYFLGERYTDSFAQGLLALERNWQGPLLTNSAVETTLQQFQDLERAGSPQDRLNWRFQQALYRAYYDAYTRDRLLFETAVENEATQVLRRAREIGSTLAMNRASEILDRARAHPVSPDRRERVGELAEALFQSIRMQLSVPKYQAISVDRGANLDTIDVPLNNRVWLEQQFAEIQALTDEPERLRRLEAIVNRTDPGPGGFYDSLGDLSRQPHLVRGAGFERDPAFLRSSLVGFGHRRGWPLAWCRNAQSLNDAPLQMRYQGLDRAARYRVRVVYSGDKFTTTIRLEADAIEVHPWLKKPSPVHPVEFDIPSAATSDGELLLTWTQEPGLGGNGRGCQVSEVWLIRKSDVP
jgi:hypothetical protein